MTPLGKAKKISAHLRSLGIATEVGKQDMAPILGKGRYYHRVIAFADAKKVTVIGAVEVHDDGRCSFHGSGAETLRALVGGC